MKKLAIFDLDGTLVNSLQDIANATNYALENLGYPTHQLEDFCAMVGNGIKVSQTKALPKGEQTEENTLRMLSFFKPYYHAHLTDYTKTYPGISKLLADFQDQGIKIAVASNKFDSGAKEVVNTLFPELEFSSILGFRTHIAPKPDPQIVYDSMQEAGISDKSEVVYLGDSDVDMQTAQNAGVDAIGVTWGFRTREELMAYQPWLVADETHEILKHILQH